MFRVIKPYALSTHTQEKAISYTAKESSDDSELKTVCDAVIQHQVTKANFSMNISGWYDTTYRASFKQPIPIIIALLQNNNCKLKELDLSNCDITFDEIKNIVESLPSDSALEKINLGNLRTFSQKQIDLYETWKNQYHTTMRSNINKTIEDTKILIPVLNNLVSEYAVPKPIIIDVTLIHDVTHGTTYH